MNWRLLFCLAALSLPAFPQAWSTFLDKSRAIDWTSAGFPIPNYTTNCSVQPTLTANNSGAAAANATAIQNALSSCDATHNVVNIPAGTYYVNGWTYGSQGKQVVRGAGPKSTYVYLMSEAGCSGQFHGICMIDNNGRYNGSTEVLPPSGTQQCLWTAGYAQGSTTLTLSSCGGAPPQGKTIILDQANDTSDTGGVFICDTNIANCGYEGSTGGNNDGRSINRVTRSQQQITYVTGVTSLGGGSYSVTISPGVYFSNIRSSQSPGAWWPGFVQNDGLENLTIDGSSIPNGNVAMYDCYQCWVKNVRSLNAGRSHVELFQSAMDVIRDSYFYQSQSHGSQSYVVEIEAASGFLVENNIFQQVTNPLMFGQGSGAVIDYNFSVDDVYTGAASFAAGSYAVHNAGSEMNLFEGNNFLGIWADDAWGSSAQGTLFRNMLLGWQSGKTDSTFPIMLRDYIRAFNIVGNVLGQPGYHNQYQAYANSSSGGVGAAKESTSIYSLGWGSTGPGCAAGAVTTCDPLVFSTLMRWGNYDVVNAAPQWNATEASPAAVPYVNANFSSSYFSSLAHTLPASLYYGSTPSWWPAGKAWPPIGPDVTSGNLGTCVNGTYPSAQAITAGQCAGGTLSGGQWASHATSIPAQDCYLNSGGAADGTGSAINFDASTCYTATGGGGGGGGTTGTPVVSPTQLGPWTTTQTVSQTLTASGFGGTVTWSKISGTAPTGLSGSCLSGATGATCTLTGVLTVAGSFSVTIRATDGTNTVDLPFAINVNAAPVVTSSGSLSAALLGQAYSQTLSISGGKLPLTCLLNTGSLPAGLSLSNCAISGVPSAVGTSTFKVSVTDGNGITGAASASLSITVTAPSGITLLSTTYCQPGMSWSSASPYTACNLTAAAPAGSTIIVGFATYNNAGTTGTMVGMTDSIGDTFVQVAGARSTSAQSGSGYWDDFWYAPNVPASVTAVFPKPSSTVSGNVFIWVVSGVNSVNAAGAVNATTSTSSAPTGAALSTTAPGTFIAAMLHPGINGNPTGVNAPFISDSVADGMAWAHLLTLSTGSYTPQWNQTATTYAASTAAFAFSTSQTLASPTGAAAMVH